MNPNDILFPIGLQTRARGTDLLGPALGVFAAGLVVGAGVALLLAPKKGSELRGDIGRTASKAATRVGETASTVGSKVSHAAHAVKSRIVRDPLQKASLEELSRDELYTRAQTMEIDGSSEMNKSQLVDAVHQASMS